MDQVGEQVFVKKIDVEYIDPDTLAKLNIKHVPTVILMVDNQEVRRFTEIKTFNQIIDFLNYG